MPQTPIRIFISYSHDSDQHRNAVLALANRLRHDGLDCAIDQYVNGFPAEGWQRWMETQIEQADFVLVVCTPVYLKRYRGLDDDGGRGVTFEGVVISQTLYDAYYRNTRFVPVLPDAGDIADVPLPLKGFGAFRMEQNYEGLYRYLTGQAAVVAPELGERVVKHPHPNPLPSRFNAALSSTQGEGLSLAATDLRFTEPDVQADGVKEQRGMSDTMRAAWLAGAFALLAAIIAGLFTLLGTPDNTTYGASSPIITGNGNQVSTPNPDNQPTETKK
ncbi:MAG: SEFIR domain-containing protein [Thiolinea sp.]